MDCPRCKTPLTARVRDSVEVDICEKCHGVWLDAGEVGKIFDAERERSDAEKRANWRLYDRGRDGYDPTPISTPTQEQVKSVLESILG